jgi:hypothetical protein
MNIKETLTSPVALLALSLGLIALAGISIQLYFNSLNTLADQKADPSFVAHPRPSTSPTTSPTSVPSDQMVSIKTTSVKLTDGWSRFTDTTHGVSFEFPTEITYKPKEDSVTFKTWTSDGAAEETDSLYYWVQNVAFAKENIKLHYDDDSIESAKIGLLNGFTSSYGDAGCSSESFYFPVSGGTKMATLYFVKCSEWDAPEEKPVASTAKVKVLSTVRVIPK